MSSGRMWLDLSIEADKVHKFWEGHKLLPNLHRGNSQIYARDFVKFCALLRIYELYDVYKNLQFQTSLLSYNLQRREHK